MLMFYNCHTECPLFAAMIAHRLLADVYVSRGLDMHLLLFHEDAHAESIGEPVPHRGVAGEAHDMEGTTGATATAPATVASRARINSPVVAKSGTGEPSLPHGARKRSGFIPGDDGTLERLKQSHGSRGIGRGGMSGKASHIISPGGGHTSSNSRSGAATGKSGRFATTGRVREFRMVLKAAAAHASKMKVHHMSFATR